MTDPVNSPKHYNAGKIEVIEVIEDWKLGFHEGNVVKYVARAKHKGSELEDLKKAAWYLNRAIENIELREGLSPMRGVHCKIDFEPVVHAFFSQNYAGTACGECAEESTRSEVDSEVTCEKCSAWIKRKASREKGGPVHYAEHDKPALCGSYGNDNTTNDPERVTCGICHRLHTLGLLKDSQIIHLKKYSNSVWCGAEVDPGYVIDVPTIATCKQCHSLFNATLSTP